MADQLPVFFIGHVSTNPTPKAIYDFGGLDKQLYEVKYEPKGAPLVTKDLIGQVRSKIEDASNEYGLPAGSPLPLSTGTGIDPIAAATNEHFLPLLYTVGLAGRNEPIEHLYEGYQYGTLSMRCFRVE